MVLASAWPAVVQAQAPAPAIAFSPAMTTAEARADAVWQLRAGLNVAALQCQFSPFLMTVPNYNALLRQHSDEMTTAFNGMNRYFVRAKGPKVGPRAFDTYATRVNQRWATFDAQYSFCEAAAMVGRQALAVPKGKFGDFALEIMAALRKSLEANARLALSQPKLEYAVMREMADPCVGKPLARCR